MIVDKPMDNRPWIVKRLEAAKAKSTEARVSQLRAFVCQLDGDAIGWLRENAGREFEKDLLKLRDGIDLLLDEAVPREEVEVSRREVA